MLVYLVRHTAYENPDRIYHGRLPLSLSLEGRKHAHRLGRWFEKRCRQIPILSSPIIRALQTAEIIACHTQSSVFVDDQLTEVWMELEGQPMPHKNPWGEIYIQSHRESFAKIKERSVTILEEQLSADGNRIMVTHGDSITLMYYYALSRKMNPNIWLNEDYIPKGGIVKVDRKSGKLSAQVIIVENV